MTETFVFAQCGLYATAWWPSIEVTRGVAPGRRIDSPTVAKARRAGQDDLKQKEVGELAQSY